MKNKCCKAIAENAEDVFEKFGQFVGRNPWRVMILVVFVTGGLSMGLFWSDKVTFVSGEFVPKESEAMHNRDLLKTKGYNMYMYSNKEYQVIDDKREVQIIVKPNPGEVFNSTFIKLANDTIDDIINIVYPNSWCQTCSDLKSTLSSIGTHLDYGNATFPVLKTSENDITFYGHLIGNPTLNGGKLTNGSGIKVIVSPLYISNDINYHSRLLDMKIRLENPGSYGLTTKCSAVITSTELRDKTMEDDFVKAIWYYIGAFVLTICLACFMMFAANSNIGQPVLLIFAQLTSTSLALMFGFTTMSMSGRSFTFLETGFIPFFVFVMGTIRLFIQISILAGQDGALGTDIKIGHVVRSSGPSITLSFLFEVIVIATGVGPNLTGYRNDGLVHFSLFSVVCTVAGYIGQLTFVPACLALHDVRMKSKSHKITEDAESYVDKLLQFLSKNMLKHKVVKLVFVSVFCVYVSVCTWRCADLQQNDNVLGMGAAGSMHRTFTEWNDEFEDITYVSFVVTERVTYTSSNTQDRIRELLNKAKLDPSIRDDFEINWLTPYEDILNNTSFNETYFVSNFINSSKPLAYDIILYNNNIMSSRFHVVSNHLPNSKAKADLMRRMRKLATDSALPVIAYSKDFIIYEQYATLLGDFLISVTLTLVCFAAFLLMFHLIDFFSMVFILLSTVTFLICLFGGMSFTGSYIPTLSTALNFITLLPIRLVISLAISMSVFVCFHCTQSKCPDHELRVFRTIRTICVPMAMVCLCCVIGLFCLIKSSSYVLSTLFSILVIGLINSVLHYATLLPVLLHISNTVLASKKCPIVLTNKVHVEVDDKRDLSKIQF